MTHFKTSTSSPVESIGSKILRMIVSAGREIRERERERRLSSVRGSSFEGAPSRIFFCIFSSTSKERRKKYARKNTPPKKKVPRSRHSFLSVFSKRTHFRPTLSNARARAPIERHIFVLLYFFFSISYPSPKIGRRSLLLLLLLLFSSVQRRPKDASERGGGGGGGGGRRIAYRRKTVHSHFSHAQSSPHAHFFDGSTALMMTPHADVLICGHFFLSLNGTLKKGERKCQRFPHWVCTGGGARDPPALRRRNGRKGLRDDDARRTTAFDVSRHRCSFCGGRR